MILLIDNYDSFTFNLYQYIGMLGHRVKVVRNDEISVGKVSKLRPKAIVISPGPGWPEEAGICLDLIKQTDRPLLGVCLGHQSLAQAFGGQIVKAKRMMHGKISSMLHQGKDLFKGIKNPAEVARYHSLVVEPTTLPSCFRVTAKTADEVIMAISHKKRPFYGIQFHPESIATDDGMKMIENFLAIAEGK